MRASVADTLLFDRALHQDIPRVSNIGKLRVFRSKIAHLNDCHRHASVRQGARQFTSSISQPAKLRDSTRRCSEHTCLVQSEIGRKTGLLNGDGHGLLFQIRHLRLLAVCDRQLV